MTYGKVERFGVSMPGEILDAIDRHCADIKEDRSAYLRRLAFADLTAVGKLPGTPKRSLRVRIDHLLETAPDVLDALLSEAVERTAATRAEGNLSI